MKIIVVLQISPALLLLLLLLPGEPPNRGAGAFPVTCCLKTKDIKVKKDLFENYSVQDKPLCPVKAVRFVAKPNVVLCSDPSSPWAINTMAFLDNRGTLQGNRTTTNKKSLHIKFRT